MNAHGEAVARSQDPGAKPLLGAVEGGGTKLVCAVGRSAFDVLERFSIPTGDPASTLSSALAFFGRQQQVRGRIDGIGLAFFGPLGLKPETTTYGQLLRTPKPGWSGVNIVEEFARAFRVPVGVDTDVGAAAMAEWHLGSGRAAASIAYVTVGTGIGVGFAPYPERSSRLLHPEAGHLRVRRTHQDQDFPGICPSHGDCLEGLASGLAIRARWDCQLTALPRQHPAWTMIGDYLGQLAATITLMTSVERIVFGGGVMARGALLPHIRAACKNYLGDYIAPLNDPAAFDRYIVGPALEENAGLAGAFLLAAEALSPPSNVTGKA
jgi:fructokinase